MMGGDDDHRKHHHHKHLYKSKFTSFAAPTMALAADGEDDEDHEAGAEESHPRYC